MSQQVIYLTNRIPQWTIGDRIRKARTAAGMEQKDLATVLHCSSKTIGRWERDDTTPSHRDLIAIAEVTHAPVEWIEHGIDPGRDGGPDPDGVETSDECVPRGSNPDPSDSRSATVTSINAAKPRHALPQAA